MIVGWRPVAGVGFAAALVLAAGGGAGAHLVSQPPTGEAATGSAGESPADTTALDAALDGLRADLDGVLAGPAWRRATWGVLAVSLDHGDTLWARNAEQALVPASNVKLFTTAAALHHLGADYRFRTWVLATGPVVDGELQGDLVLYGTGDPGLSDRFHDSRGAVMDTLAAQVERSGIRRVRGRVLGDGTFFEGPDRLPAWDPADLNDAFAAASSALSYNENVVTLRVSASAPGLPPRVETIPDHGGVPWINAARTAFGRPAERLVIERADPLDPILVRGELSSTGGDVWRRMTVQSPAWFAAHAFDLALSTAGVTVAGEPATVEAPGASPLTATTLWTDARADAPRVVAEHRSRPLLDYLAVVNQESHNLLADLILRTLGRVVTGEGSYEAGTHVVERFLIDQVGIAEDAVHVADGSGLSDTNRASPEAFVALVAHLAERPLWNDFWSTLPEAGSRGFSRMRRTPAAGRLRAKTGTIRGVSALSGMVVSVDGERIAFSLIGNDLPSAWGAKRLEDLIGARLASWSGSGAYGRPPERSAEPPSQFDD